MSDDKVLVKAKTVKEYIKETHDLNCGGDVAEALDAKVKELVNDAARRAVDNDRKTLQGKDV
ncbi:hypothetical protein LCGC14_0145170 [marine sediment metagenome]|uniref:Transcription factor CBF/NF-Y/archaeal histone domain-containing protein n=1 Tax=marine sediment metagenome TaxID=412755 RepID=A0A0F9UZQ9_9ZZZZ